MRVGFLDGRDLAQVVVECAVRDQLDVIEAEQFPAIIVDAAVAGGDVDDRLEAERFPYGAAPAGVESATDLILGIRRRSAGQPKRVGGLDAAEFDGKVWHEKTPN